MICLSDAAMAPTDPCWCSLCGWKELLQIRPFGASDPQEHRASHEPGSNYGGIPFAAAPVHAMSLGKEGVLGLAMKEGECSLSWAICYTGSPLLVSPVVWCLLFRK